MSSCATISVRAKHNSGTKVQRQQNKALIKRNHFCFEFESINRLSSTSQHVSIASAFFTSFFTHEHPAWCVVGGGGGKIHTQLLHINLAGLFFFVPSDYSVLSSPARGVSPQTILTAAARKTSRWWRDFKGR